MVFSIPIDFGIEFRNSTFSPVLEYTEEVFFNRFSVSFLMVQTPDAWLLQFNSYSSVFFLARL